MKIVIVGAGVIGVTSAYYLSRAGYEVEVIDRQPGPALETSFANAGEISPGYASPWAGPGVPLKALRWMLMRHPPLVVALRLDPSLIVWLWRFLENCTAERYDINKARMLRLAEYSRDELRALRASTGIEYDARQRGTLQLFRAGKQLKAAEADVAVLRKLGIPFELLDRRGCVEAEPGLANSAVSIVGGLRLPNDETGDCYEFTSRVARLAKEMGARFRFGTTVRTLAHNGNLITAVNTDSGPARGDQYVLAAGSFSPALARSLGLSLPIYPEGLLYHRSHYRRGARPNVHRPRRDLQSGRDAPGVTHPRWRNGRAIGVRSVPARATKDHTHTLSR